MVSIIKYWKEDKRRTEKGPSDLIILASAVSVERWGGRWITAGWEPRGRGQAEKPGRVTILMQFGREKEQGELEEEESGGVRVKPRFEF